MPSNSSKLFKSTSLVTIINYHFIRKVPKIRGIKLNALSKAAFINQLDFMINNYNFISVTDCINAIYNNKKLPRNPIMLTFDDGYIEHYTTVFPLLIERSVSGCFFPVEKTVTEKKMLQVNKIHLVLGSIEINVLIDDISRLIKQYKSEYNLKNFDDYRENISYLHPYDTKDVIFVKNLLQIALKREIRKIIIDKLFKKYVTNDEVGFCQELYITEDQIKLMIANGMHVGSHSYSHEWLNRLNPRDQENEIIRSTNFLKKLGIDHHEFVMSYPYGGYDDGLINILNENNFKLAFTTRPGKTVLSKTNAFMLERYDTNDFSYN